MDDNTWCSGWLWYPAFRHWAIVDPWNITRVKYESNSKILSAAMDATSRRIGSGGEWNEKEISEGWIITIELVTFSRYSIIRKYAVSSGLLLKTYKRESQLSPKDNFFVKIISLYHAFMGSANEYLDKLRSAQVKHKLRENW